MQRINFSHGSSVTILSCTRMSLSILMHDVIDSPMAGREKTVTAAAALNWNLQHYHQKWDLLKTLHHTPVNV